MVYPRFPVPLLMFVEGAVQIQGKTETPLGWEQAHTGYYLEVGLFFQLSGRSYQTKVTIIILSLYAQHYVVDNT